MKSYTGQFSLPFNARRSAEKSRMPSVIPRSFSPPGQGSPLSERVTHRSRTLPTAPSNGPRRPLGMLHALRTERTRSPRRGYLPPLGVSIEALFSSSASELSAPVDLHLIPRSLGSSFEEERSGKPPGSPRSRRPVLRRGLSTKARRPEKVG